MRNGAAEVLDRLRQLATSRDSALVAISRNAQRDIDALDYDFDDICDCLCELELRDLKSVEDGKWRPGTQVAIFCTEFALNDDVTDRLYVKVQVSSNGLYVLSFKLDGSPR